MVDKKSSSVYERHESKFKELKEAVNDFKQKALDLEKEWADFKLLKLSNPVEKVQKEILIVT